MGNIGQWLIDAEQQTGETIEAIVVGKHDSDTWSWATDRRPPHQRDVVLTRAEGIALLFHEYDNGFGPAVCFPMYAWSASYVYLVHEYDGATSVARIPRHPMACTPEFGGS